MEQLQVSKPKTDIGRSSFKHRAAIIWNALPRNAETIRSCSAFKCELSKISKIVNTLPFGQSSIIKNRNNALQFIMKLLFALHWFFQV